MANKLQFSGEVVRIEPDGFGVVRFDDTLGSNTHGLFSTRLSTFQLPVEDIRQGMHVHGTAEVDERDLAAIRILSSGTR